MKLEIPIIVGFDDIDSLLDDLKKLQTYKLFEGDEMVLVDIEDVAKVLMDHVKAKKSVKGDMISRADAVDAISKIKRTDNWQAAASMALMDLPSAQPEIIRCTECKHYREYDSKYVENAVVVQCMADRYPISETIPDGWFCAGAERRTDEQTKD